MENKKDKTQAFIDKTVEPIFNKVAREATSNSMTTKKPTFSIMWRPNNYRRQITVKTKDNSIIQKIQTAINHYPNPHTKIISVRGYLHNQITLQYAKNTLTGIFSQNKIGNVKEIYHIEANSITDLNERIDQKSKEIQKNIDNSINKFIEQFDIRIPGAEAKWSRYEDFVKGEEYIDKIPSEVIIHDTYFKKVYGKGIEFIKKGVKPTVSLKTYIKNRAIEDISPEIATELSNTQQMVQGVLDMNFSTSKLVNQHVRLSLKEASTLNEFHKDIRVHNKVLKGINQSFRKFNKLLTEKQKKLGDWL